MSHVVLGDPTGMDDEAISRALTLLTRLAGGEFDARGSVTGTDDELDAIIVGLNMLGEELQAGHERLEERVAARTAELTDLAKRLVEEGNQRVAAESALRATNDQLQQSVMELEQLNRGIFQLTELGNLLQACENIDEAYAVITQSVAAVFGGLSGAVYLFNASRNVLEAKSQWGHPPSPNLLHSADCWALRRGRMHVIDDGEGQLVCKHIANHGGRSICVPLAARGDTIGLLFVTDHHGDEARGWTPLGDNTRRLAVVVAEQIELAIANLQLRETLRVQALRDPLTHLYNRRFVDDWLGQEADRADRSGDPLGVLMIDIDNFKALNDTHGHNAGDQLLTAIAGTLRHTVRTGDVVCRYGGEEFLVLCPGAGLDTAAARAEQLREAIAQIRVEHAGTVLPAVTVSIGVAVYPINGAHPLAVINAADAALYAAKRRGRNCVYVANPDGGADNA